MPLYISLWECWSSVGTETQYGGRTLNLHFDKMVLRYDAVGNVERACGEQTLCSRLWMVLILSYATDCHCNVAFVKCYILSAPFLKFEATLSLCMPNIL